MGDLAEDRVYDEHTDDDTAHLATGAGVATVRVANGRVGRFRLAHRCVARDVAAALRGDGTLVAVATDEDVLVHHPDVGAEEWMSTGFGRAEAVGVDATGDAAALVAVAADDHAVGRVLDPTVDPTDWLTVADVDAPAHAVEGQFLAAADGVYRLTPDGVDDVGLDDVRDVAVVRAGDGPWADTDALAATADGLFRLAPGPEASWERDLDGEFDAVAAAGERAVAVGDRGVHVHEPAPGAEAPSAEVVGWRGVDVPKPPVDVGVGQLVYGVTADGAFLAREESGWRTRTLGFPEVRAMVVRPA